MIGILTSAILWILVASAKGEDNDDRVAKALAPGLFSVVKFANSPCGSTTNLNGTCLSEAECKTEGGTASGTCASGYGVCCVVSITCGGSTSTNNTYIKQTSTTDATSCHYSVTQTSTSICQIRLDFETFEMAPASTTTGRKGMCIDDTMTISSPTGPNPPLFCGKMTGQHMYLDASSEGLTFMAIIGSTDTSTSRQWSIRVSQIECSSVLRAPAGCLQYHWGTTGYIHNFGWDGTSNLAASSDSHQNNQEYNICFRREEGYCSMEYFASTTGFALSVNSIASEALYGDSCSEDYLTIPGLRDAPSTATTAFTTAIGDRVCGLSWKYPESPGSSKTLVTYTKPFTVGVTLNHEDEGSNDSQVGFAVLFTQASCT